MMWYHSVIVFLQNKSPRIVSVDALRSLGVLLVLAVHLGFLRVFLGMRQEAAWIPFGLAGGYGVSLFFVVSGFLITRILVRPTQDLQIISLRNFYVQRIGRIWPLLFLTCVLGFCISRWSLGPGRAGALCFSAPIKVAAFWASIAAFVFNWFRIFTETTNHVYGFHWAILWSLSVEEQYYLFYPLLLIGLKNVRMVVIFLCVIVVCGLFWRGAIYHWWPDHYLLSITASFGAFDQIAVGCLLFFVQRDMSQRGRTFSRTVAWTLMAAGSGLLFLVFWRTSLYLSLHRVFSPSLLGLGVFLMLLGGMQWPIRESMLTRILCLPGQLSYGIYLLHPLVMYFFSRWLMCQNPMVAYGVFVVLNVGMAGVVFRLFEMPMNRYIRARFMI